MTSFLTENLESYLRFKNFSDAKDSEKFFTMIIILLLIIIIICY